MLGVCLLRASACNILLCSLFSLTLWASEDGDDPYWTKYVTGFRQDHHFSLVGGQTKGVWKIKEFGQISNHSEDAEGVFAKFRYSFHLPLFGPLGYALGTSLGVTKQLGTKDNIFYANIGLQLPSLYLAMIYQFNSRLQLLIGAESYLERWEGLEDRSSHVRVDATMVVAIDETLIVDYFYDLSKGVRLEMHQRQSKFQHIKDASGKVEDVTFRLNESWIGLGVLFHLI